MLPSELLVGGSKCTEPAPLGFLEATAWVPAVNVVRPGQSVVVSIPGGRGHSRTSMAEDPFNENTLDQFFAALEDLTTAAE